MNGEPFITLVGLGCGTPDTLTQQAHRALACAEILVGARRLLEGFESPAAEKIAATKAKDILSLIASNPGRRICVVYSGDSGFYSGAGTLAPLLEERKIPFQILPGISSVQAMASALGTAWQGWNLVSAHGVACDAVAAVNTGRPAFFLTGGTLGPCELCAQLTQAGLGFLCAAVGENLSYETQRVFRGTVQEFSQRPFAPLSVLWVEAAPKPWQGATQGIADAQFIRGDVPMTKREVRSCALSMLALRPGEILWDIGAGTGSVSVEMALTAPSARVYAVECEEEALCLLQKNRERFGAWNMTIIAGKAPEALSQLPAAHAAFIGGSQGNLAAILEEIYVRNPSARVVVPAVTVETLSQASQWFAARGKEIEITQLSVSRSRKAGRVHLLTAQNPIFLIAAE